MNDMHKKWMKISEKTFLKKQQKKHEANPQEHHFINILCLKIKMNNLLIKPHSNSFLSQLQPKAHI